ncbi:hypothetical protein [Lysinibacter cavernae]|uniref:Uncharacterized protein n=1 Tax=Lysinibacter cavernae TaxID=1640652 RepID=A0A7X5TSC5_9MICO|nr:hypothetical protein [Lysinibacter cavernae]NIH53361.1 hypothetical protein [Lysinibacter cavernae]
MNDFPSEAPSRDDGLLSQLTVIEEQPLERRAEAYLSIHAELQAQLEGGDIHR